MAKNNSTKNLYIQSATLDGKPLDKPWFYHTELVDGGSLVLEMEPTPNTAWGSGRDAVPPQWPVRLSYPYRPPKPFPHRS